MTALLRLEKVCVGYQSADGEPVLLVNEADLTLDPGETLGVVGESGCGKSTLLLSIMGHYKPGLKRLSGGVLFEGQDPDQASVEALQRLRGGGMALIPQNAGQALTPTLKISAQMVEALQLHSEVPATHWKNKSIELFERVQLPSPEKLLDRYPHELSGGQQQRVAIAMALAGSPRLLLLDEPTTGLDVTTQAQVLQLLSEISETTQTAMVFVSHDIGVIAKTCQKIAVMYAGEIIEAGTQETVMAQPGHPYTQALLASVPRLGQASLPDGIRGRLPESLGAPKDSCAFEARCGFSEAVCRTQKPDVIDVKGHLIKCSRQSSIAPFQLPNSSPRAVLEGFEPERKVVLAVRDLALTYQSTGPIKRWLYGAPEPVVADVSLELRQGQTLGLVGESGSGKSSILRTLAGLQPGLRGMATFLNQHDLLIPVGRRSPEVLRKIQLVFQNPDASLNPRRTIRDIIERPLRLYFNYSAPERSAEAYDLMDSVQLPRDYLDRFPGQLSGGERQRVAIARALAAKPDLLLCDEITSALDVSVQASMMQLLTELKSKRQLTVLFVSHDLPVVGALADHVAILRNGRICEAGATQEIFEQPAHPYTRELLAAVLSHR